MLKLKLMLNLLCNFLLMVKLKKLLMLLTIFLLNLLTLMVLINMIFLLPLNNNHMEMESTLLKEMISTKLTNPLKLSELKTLHKKLKLTDNKLKISVKKKINWKPKLLLNHYSPLPKDNTKTWISPPP